MSSLYDIYLKHQVITTDSRNCPEGSIFFALRGDNFDGNLYAAKALECGASYAVVDRPEVATDNRYIVVSNVLLTLQELAAEHRCHLQIPIIGITGTNGKTTTKELIATVLARKYRTTATVGNFNNHIGVPLTLLSIPTDAQIAVVEMGANHPGEIAELAKIVRPTHALITNVGKAHLEGFGSIEGVLQTKKALYDQVKSTRGTLIVNIADPMLVDAVDDYAPIVTYSASDSIAADVNAHIVPSSTPYLNIKWRERHIESHFIGTYNINNILAAITVGENFDVPHNKIEAAIREYTPTNSRSQLTTTEHNTLIVDAYNANPTSMAASLDSFATIEATNKTAILGDMLELGTQSADEHSKIVEQLAHLGLKAILIGDQFAQCKGNNISLPNTAQLIDYLQAHPLTAHTILLKGSNGIGLQKVVKYL